MNVLFVSAAILLAFFVASCGFFGNTGEVRQEQPRKTVFRSGDDTPIDTPEVTPKPQKVPGE